MKKKAKRESTDTKVDRLTGIVKRGFKSVEERMERGFATVADDIADIQDIMATKDEVREIIKEEIAPLEIKIDKLDTKLGKFEESEVDKKKRIEVRIGGVEKHFGVKPPAGTIA